MKHNFRHISKKESLVDIIINHGQTSHLYSEKSECYICQEKLRAFEQDSNLKPIFKTQIL